VQGLSHVGAVQEVRQQDEERGVLFLLRAGLMDVLLRAAGCFRRVPCSGASLA
jgi:hypothetical protein